MTTRHARMAIFTLAFSFVASIVFAADEKSSADTYLLRYKFRPGESIRWEVEQQAQVRTTVAGTTQTAETHNTSVKVWKVTGVDPQGRITFIHSVESVDMRQKISGRQEVRYNSLTDKQVPPGFEHVAKAVGVPLSVATMEATGTLIKREEKQAGAGTPTSRLTLPLPEEPVEIGHKWQVPEELTVTAKDKAVRKIKVRQQMTLEEVSDGIATIRIESQLLTPVSDPAIEAQLVQSEATGKVRFDIEDGRIVGQQTNLDKTVIGFQGEASSLHYMNRFVEKLLPASATTAARPKPVAGPALPPGR